MDFFDRLQSSTGILQEVDAGVKNGSKNFQLWIVINTNNVNTSLIDLIHDRSQAVLHLD
jgi:hypothetical protein